MPGVFDDISLPRPRKPVVTAGSPYSAYGIASFGTFIYASSITGDFIDFSILVVVDSVFVDCSCFGVLVNFGRVVHRAY